MIRNKDELREFYQGIDGIPDALLEQWTTRLAGGETGSEAEGLSRAILRDFIRRAWLGQEQSPVTLEWLADALDRILNYEDAQIALVLPKRPKHRPGGLGARKAVDVACWVALTIDRGYSRGEAEELAATTFQCAERSIRRMRAEAAGWPETMNPTMDWEEHYRCLSRPLPPRKVDAK